MKPAISVITVCHNALAGLRRTGRSVEAQACRDFEWIIIDGESTDGTQEFLGGLGDTARWISERDSGIYAAMNKGLHLASGHRIWFMNAGDIFHDRESLGKIAAMDPDIDIGFGEVVVVAEDGTVLGPRSTVTPHALPRELRKTLFQRGMVVSHQAFVPKRSIAPEFQDQRYRYSADLDWMLTILSEPRSSLNLGTIAQVIREGATLQNWNRSQWERFCILSRHFGLWRNLCNHIAITSRRINHGLRTSIWR